MHAIIIYGKEEEQLHSFLTMALQVYVQTTSHPSYFTPGGISSWVGPRNRLYLL